MSETDLAEVWARSLAELAGMQIEPAHRAWLQLTRPLGLVENTALIATPNEFVKEQLETRLRALITNTLSRELGRNIQLAVTVDPTAAMPDPGHRPSGLRGLTGLRDEPGADAADATTGPLPRIRDDRPGGRGGEGPPRPPPPGRCSGSCTTAPPPTASAAATPRQISRPPGRR